MITVLTNETESGETMRAAGLKAIATVVESTAVLIRSKHPSDPKLVNLITARIRGMLNPILLLKTTLLTAFRCDYGTKIRTLYLQR